MNNSCYLKFLITTLLLSNLINCSLESSLNMDKDSLKPTPSENFNFNPQLKINSGDTYSSSNHFFIEIEPDGATHISLHQNKTDCDASSYWEPIITEQYLPISNLNNKNTIYFKLRNESNISTCAEQSIMIIKSPKIHSISLYLTPPEDDRLTKLQF